MATFHFRNATIIDGGGTSPQQGDVLVDQNQITLHQIGAEIEAAETIDCTGLVLCPGFIDIHTHSDGVIVAYPNAESRVHQGVTTEVAGNCGMSAAPLFGDRSAERRRRWMEEEGIACEWQSVDDYLSHLESIGIAVNHALLLGHGSLRKNIAGEESRALDANEMRRMASAVEEGMEQGAFGFSTGLEYAPGRWTPFEELADIARLVHQYGGLCASHIRNEQEGLLEAVDEALEVGRRSDIPVQVSHLKACGKRNWHLQQPAIEMIESARLSGLDVMADVYPYAAYSTELAILLSSWAREGGVGAIAARLADAGLRGKIRQELKERISLSPGDFSCMSISRVLTEANQCVVGMNLEQIAERWSVEPEEAIARLLEEERCAVSFVGHGMSEENVEAVLARPWAMIGSDGFCVSPHGRGGCSRPHPRSYGTFPRVLGHYARNRNAVTLTEAIHKMTGMPARRMGLSGRGFIADGMKADLVVFDGNQIEDRATFSAPHQYPIGMRHVMVNGEFVIREEKATGARPGRVLRKSQPSQKC